MMFARLWAGFCKPGRGAFVRFPRRGFVPFYGDFERVSCDCVGIFQSLFEFHNPPSNPMGLLLGLCVTCLVPPVPDSEKLRT